MKLLLALLFLGISFAPIAVYAEGSIYLTDSMLNGRFWKNNYNDIKEGDIIEAVQEVAVKKTLK